MNFGEEIKNEIFSKTLKDRKEKTAFLSGLIRATGVLFEEDERLGLYFTVAGEDRAFTASSLLERLFGYQVREIDVKEDRLNRKDRFEMVISGDGAKEVLSSLGIISVSGGETAVEYDFYGKAVNDAETFKAFIRGLFAGVGGCTVPDGSSEKGTGYHLEMVFSHDVTAENVSSRLSEYGINGRIIRRRDNFVLYFKSAETIKDLLAFLALPKCVLKFTEIMVMREFINDVNRKKNCDLGNVSRQVSASIKINEAVEILKEKGLFDGLKAELKETAEKKIAFPDDSYGELAAKLNVTKSCLNHRFRKLQELAEKAKG